VKAIFILLQLAPLVAMLACLLWFWRDCRKHRRIMRLLDDADKAVDTFKTCKTPEELNAKLERVNEIHEHVRQLQKR
jgi:hypothetical protein